MIKKCISCTLVFIVFVSCTNVQNDAELSVLKAGLAEFEKQKTIEEKTRKYAQDYVRAINSTHWKTEVPKYLKAGKKTDRFLKEHTEFRKSFPNFKTGIKHVMVNGNKCILWLEETANFVAPFAVTNSDYGDNVLNGIKPKNQFLSWNEVWYFDVVDGKFGGQWDFLKDNYAVLKGLKDDK